MNKNTIETVLGAVVLAIAAIFMFFAYNVASLGSSSGYTVKAEFDRVDGLAQGTDVRMSGIKVGSVTGQRLNPENYRAEVDMTIDESVKLPTDTVAEISTEGLLGGKYLSLVPGTDEEFIPAGGSIEFTQAPLDLMQLLGKFIFSSKDKDEKAKPAVEKAPTPSPAPAKEESSFVPELSPAAPAEPAVKNFGE